MSITIKVKRFANSKESEIELETFSEYMSYLEGAAHGAGWGLGYTPLPSEGPDYLPQLLKEKRRHESIDGVYQTFDPNGNIEEHASLRDALEYIARKIFYSFEII